MNPRNRTVQKTDRFVLRKRTRKSNGKIYYELACNMDFYSWTFDDYERVRNILDPTRNRSGQFGRSWKYKSRAAAEQDLVVLLMQL